MSQARWWIRASWPKRNPEVDKVLFTVEVGDFIVPWRFEATVIRDDKREDYAEGGFSRDWPPIRMQIVMQDGRPVVRELTIGEPPEPPVFVTGEDRQRLGPEALDELFYSDHDEGRAPQTPRSITASLLRELPLARLAKYAMLGVAVRFGEGPMAERVVPSDLTDGGGFYRIGPDQVADDYGVYIIDTPAWQELWSDHMEALVAYADRAATATRRNRISDELLDQVAHVYREAIAERRPPKKAVQQAWHVSEATAGRYITRARERGYLGKTLPGKKGEIIE